ncbi:hypothetical protein D3C71_1995040 [compost metagenome]
MGGRSSRVDDALGNALMVEVLDLFAQHEILEQGRAAAAGLQRVLVVADRHAVVGRKARVRRRGGLVEFAAFTGLGVCRGWIGHGVSFS